LANHTYGLQGACLVDQFATGAPWWTIQVLAWIIITLAHITAILVVLVTKVTDHVTHLLQAVTLSLFPALASSTSGFWLLPVAELTRLGTQNLRTRCRFQALAEVASRFVLLVAFRTLESTGFQDVIRAVSDLRIVETLAQRTVVLVHHQTMGTVQVTVHLRTGLVIFNWSR